MQRTHFIQNIWRKAVFPKFVLPLQQRRHLCYSAKTDLRGPKMPLIVVRVEHKICGTMCGTPVQAIWDQKNLTELAWGVRKVKICPRMTWIWLWSRPEAPKWVNDPWNGSQMVSPTALDWFESISWPFEALQPLYIKETQIILTWGN